MTRLLLEPVPLLFTVAKKNLREKEGRNILTTPTIDRFLYSKPSEEERKAEENHNFLFFFLLLELSVLEET